MNKRSKTKNTIKNRAEVLRALSMITGFGISMVTPVLLCVFAAKFLQKKFGLPDWIMPAAVLLGAASSFWSMIKMIKTNSKKDE